MFTKIFLNALESVWPMIFIFTFIIVSLRLLYLFANKKEFIFHKELLMLFFIIYILLLYHIVTFQDNNYGTNNLVPFKEILRYNITSSLFVKNVLGNILLFVPFGLFTSYIVKNKTVFPTAILTFLVSCSIEFAQMCIGRTADVDDVILNTIGGIVGYIIYYVFMRISDKMPEFMKKNVFLDILAILIVVLITYVIYKFGIGGINV